MSIRNRGKRLANGITAVVGAGSLASAGIAAAVLYSGTPSSASNTSGSSGTGSVPGSGSQYDGNQYNTRSRGFGGINPVQPGSGGVTHGNASGS